MYCVEGEIDVREKPDKYIGSFGFYHVEAATIEMPYSGTFSHHDVIARTGDEDFVVSEHERLVEEGDVGVASRIEYIASEEEAEKYLKEATLPFAIVKRSLEKLNAEFDTFLPDHLDVLSGNAQLWKEKRRPTSRFYNKAKGVLLDEVVFEPGHGWLLVDQELEGERTVKGIITPFAYKAEIVTEIERRQAGFNFVRESSEKNTRKVSGKTINIRLGRRDATKNAG
ncbi:MAG: hypothetical protein U0524_00435 [Candidatus Saccharimonadales bacterium]